tara:strand:- start:99164 stop:100690 length:1527 start_codon:yes stop_codon:yes gene_type:complete
MDIIDYYFQTLKEPQRYSLEDFKCIQVKGPDASSFLQNQTTNNVLSLSEMSFQTNCLLTPKGLIDSIFLLLKINENEFQIIVEKEFLERTIERLDKFLISEDVELTTIDQHYSFYFGRAKFEGLEGFFYGEKGWLSDKDLKINKTSDLKLFKTLSGYVLFSDINGNTLFNNSGVINFAYDPKKGCFPGNETISKIESRKGAGFKDTLLFGKGELTLAIGDALRIEGRKVATINDLFKLDDDNFILKVDLLRDYRIENKKLTLDDFSSELIVHNLPYYNSNEKHTYLYDRAIELFQASQDEKAIEYLKLVLFYKPDYADAYETLAVILGRHDRYDEAIELLEKLVEVDPKSVMAHTNLSMFHMKLGNIEVAEEHKSQATLKSFEKFGEEAENKRRLEEAKEAEKAEEIRKEGMFKQVLEIDEEDPLANYGMAEILFKRNTFNEAKSHLEKVLQTDAKYSVAYLLLGKVHLSLGEKDLAKSVFTNGVEIAAKNGDLMPANEMQRFLNDLN